MAPELSIIIAVLDSHEVFRRQLLHFIKMGFDSTVEFVFVDDGSDPPLNFEGLPSNFSYIVTYDDRPWTQPCARNRGGFASIAPRLLFTDIDHILTKEAIEYCVDSEEDKIMFPRKWGVITEEGDISQDKEVLLDYGLSEIVHPKRGLSAGMHHNTFMMRAEIFYVLDGYDESFCGKYGGDDTNFSEKYRVLCREKKEVKPHVTGPDIYVYPDPHNDKKEIFHSLRR